MLLLNSPGSLQQKKRNSFAAAVCAFKIASKQWEYGQPAIINYPLQLFSLVIAGWFLLILLSLFS